jgi:hypothetical protein
MWEVRGYPLTFNELLQWVCDVAVPRMEHEFGHISTEIFSSADHRIVVISRWRGEPVEMPTPPKGLIARSAHAWDFTPVDR